MPTFHSTRPIAMPTATQMTVETTPPR
jgi:hypothetical protein